MTRARRFTADVKVDDHVDGWTFERRYTFGHPRQLREFINVFIRTLDNLHEAKGDRDDD